MEGRVKRYKLKLNSIEKIEELLQELYNEADKNIVEVQDQINKLTSSVQLNEEIMDGKAKYAKAINDFITSKDKAISRKLEIAKLMSDIHKYNGNIQQAVSDDNSIGDWDMLKDSLDTGAVISESSDDAAKYKLKKQYT